MSKKLVIIGASGHGKVIADIALKIGYEVIGFLDDADTLQETCGFPVLGKTKDIVKYKDQCEFVIAIGNNSIRENVAEKYNVQWATLIHPAAVLGINVQIGEGTVVMANVVINPCASIGKHCIINTGAIVEHDNNLEDYVHISPNATHIGVGACVKNNITIAENVVVGAGAVVVKDIEESGVYVGVPIHILK